MNTLSTLSSVNAFAMSRVTNFIREIVIGLRGCKFQIKGHLMEPCGDHTQFHLRLPVRHN
jgi:hypothetical protein